MKRLLQRRICAAAAMLLTAVFAVPHHAQAKDYDIKIGGMMITSSNYQNITAAGGFTAVKSGTVTYNPDTKTLTLNNAKIEASIHDGIETQGTSAYTIEIKGNENLIAATYNGTGGNGAYALYAGRNPITITGGGKATFKSVPWTAILACGGLTIAGGCDITATGARVGLNGIGFWIEGDDWTYYQGPLIINNHSVVRAKGGDGEYSYSIYGFSSITLNDCQIMSPAGAYIEDGAVWLDGERSKEEVVIAQPYGVRVGGVELTSANYRNITSAGGFTAVKKGTVTYNPDTRTLFLHEATIEAEARNAIDFTEGPEDSYELCVTGTNSIREHSIGLQRSALETGGKNFTIWGNNESRATFTSSYCGIHHPDASTQTTLTIRSGVDITATGVYGIAGRNGTKANLKVNGSIVRATGSSGSVCDFRNITLEDCVISAPSGAVINNGDIVKDGQLCKEQVVIEPEKSYGITIGGKVITNANYGNITAANGFSAVKGGTVYYSPDSQTLTLSNARIEAANVNAIDFTGAVAGAYTLMLSGTGNQVAATGANRSALETGGYSLTITGDGKAAFSSADYCAIHHKDPSTSEKTLTITGGCTVTATGKYGIAGYNGTKANLRLDGTGTTVTATGSSGSICDFKKITILGLYILEPEGAVVEGGSVTLDGQLCKERVVIADSQSFGVEIGGVEITNTNYRNITAAGGFPAVKSGKVTYDPGTRTLSLSPVIVFDPFSGSSTQNVSIEAANTDAIRFPGTASYTLEINGTRVTNHFISTSGTGKRALIIGGNNFTITGGAKVWFVAPNGLGIEHQNIDTESEFTITGGCDVTVDANYGITGGSSSSKATLKIDDATVKAKGFYGSILNFKKITLVGSTITQPAGAYIEGGNVMLDGRVCSDEVVITRDATGIGTVKADVSVRKRGIYSLQGVKMQGDFESLPAGVYIVDGKKVIKK